jgi:hypothetical protein
MSVDPQANIAMQKEHEQSILQADILQSEDKLDANRNVAESNNVRISSSVVGTSISEKYQRTV